MATVNPRVSSGDGFGSDQLGSTAALTVTGANDMAWTRINSEPFVGGGSQGFTLTAQAAGTVNSADLANRIGGGGNFYINVTAVTGSLTVTIQGKDPASGVYYTILTSAAIAATGLTVLRIHPGLVAAANTIANDCLPFTYRIQAVVATGPVTATIAATLLL